MKYKNMLFFPLKIRFSMKKIAKKNYPPYVWYCRVRNDRHYINIT